MYFLYSLGLTVCFLALFPYFVYQAVKHGKYSHSFRQRLGWLPADLYNRSAPAIWVHAVSVGEFLAAEPLIAALRSLHPEYRIAVSTTTLTGQRLAASRLGVGSEAGSRAISGAVQPGGRSGELTTPAFGAILGVFYFPFDWMFAVRRSLDRISPAAVIVLETEIWPNFLRECHRRRIPVMLANGRISPRSARRYLRVRSFIKKVLDNFTLMLMQSQGDAERITSMGAESSRVRVCGNLKYDIQGQGPGSEESSCSAELDRAFRLSKTSNLIVAGSTAPGEEKMLLSAFKTIKQNEALKDARLLIAPRHPERFPEVAKLISTRGLSFVRRSECKAGDASSVASDVILLDSIGELASVYRFAAVVFVGGSLVRRGGHNILEAAIHSKPVIVGPFTDNFRQMVGDFVAARAAIQITAGAALQIRAGDPNQMVASLTQELTRLLLDKQAAHGMGERARKLLVENQGAAQRMMAAISPLLPGAAPAGATQPHLPASPEAY